MQGKWINFEKIVLEYIDEKFKKFDEVDGSLFWKRSILNISGDNDIEETPVPIPNTEVKL